MQIRERAGTVSVEASLPHGHGALPVRMSSIEALPCVSMAPNSSMSTYGCGENPCCCRNSAITAFALPLLMASGILVATSFHKHKNMLASKATVM